MNKRIKALSVQATDFANYQNEMFGVNFNDAYNEKFAELIVQECATLLPIDMTHGPDGRLLEQVFKEHFGVE